MIILFWLACFFWLAFTIILFVIMFSEYLFQRFQLSTLGMILRQFLFAAPNRRQKPRYPLDLWVWEHANDGKVCADCHDRASWPPMDIAEWIKEGLPRTPECDTQCGENCRCQIVPYKPRYLNERHPQH